MPSDYPSPNSKSALGRYGFLWIFFIAILILGGALGFNSTNHNPAAVPPVEVTAPK